MGGSGVAGRGGGGSHVNSKEEGGQNVTLKP